MRRATSFFLLTSIFLSTSCAMQQAQNAQEFRQMAPANSYGKHETFIIDNSYSKAVSNFKSRSDECLNTGVVVTTRNQTGARMGEQTLTYTPTLVVGKTKSELSIQQNVSGDGMIMGKVPEKGMFIFLADLSNLDNNKSRLDVYRITYRGTNEMVSAVKNWASGNSLDCPDLTK
jgi:hypothetical protein